MPSIRKSKKNLSKNKKTHKRKSHSNSRSRKARSVVRKMRGGDDNCNDSIKNEETIFIVYNDDENYNQYNNNKLIYNGLYKTTSYHVKSDMIDIEYTDIGIDNSENIVPYNPHVNYTNMCNNNDIRVIFSKKTPIRIQETRL